MANRIANFYQSSKCTILWTIFYIAATWAIMKYMFNFDIFSRLRWWQLAHAHLHGFPGFVFGILILAAVPMYIATTIVIARTNKPLFTVKIPEFIKNAFYQPPMSAPAPKPEPAKAPDVQPDQTKPVEAEKPIPVMVPNEMRAAYMRAREHTAPMQKSAFDLAHTAQPQSSNTQSVPEMAAEPVQEMPIPTDFDIDDVDDMTDSIPTFTDISFDDVDELPEIVKPIANFLDNKFVPYEVDDDIVITDKFAIASHTDPDFWVADPATWFAAGKTRKSPIESVKRVAKTHDVIPVLYLAADNIMDIDTLIPEWENAGIRIITDLKDLM